MILKGNQRGNSTDLARHLLSPDNEKAIVFQLRGFVGDDLNSALLESYAISRATQGCTQHMYSLSLNPPKGANVDATQFEEAIDRAEQKLGLTGQPRAIVIHHKRGRDGEIRIHAHSVWCRVDGESLKAIPMRFDRRKLNALSRELFLENNWELPAGYENQAETSKLNYTHAEHQQARRRGKYADDIKRLFQSAWAQSDSKESFGAALEENGYVLARGDRGRFVAVDGSGEVLSLPRVLGIKTKDVRARLGEHDELRNVEDAQNAAAALSIYLVPQPNNSPEATPPTPMERRVRHDPAHVLTLISKRESVFRRTDIAKELDRYINDRKAFQEAYASVMASDRLVSLTHGSETPTGSMRYSTKELQEIEAQLLVDANRMSKASLLVVPEKAVSRAIDRKDAQLRTDIGTGLSAEQVDAIEHLTKNEQLSCLVGVAGAGKSTILSAAKEAWEASGHRVYGAALAGKAAKGLCESSGIESRTLASLELSWANGYCQLERGDILVVDEAGMIGSHQMSRILQEVNDKGAKLVLIGDAEQLQPIEAGAPFRAITERVDAARLDAVFRQEQEWQQRASQNLAIGAASTALEAYARNGAIEFSDSGKSAVSALAEQYVGDLWKPCGPPSQLALAHRKKDVRNINQAIRERRKEAGELPEEQEFKTSHGKRRFAAGDRLLFTRNDRDLGVQNGMLGTVLEVSEGQLKVLPDEAEKETNVLTLRASEYDEFDHGYATINLRVLRSIKAMF